MITANGLTLVYDYGLPGQQTDIYIATRAMLADPSRQA